MSLMTIPWTLSKRLWARARARGEPSYFIVFSKNARCSSVRGCTYLTIGTSSWGVQSKAKVYIVLDMGRYYTKKLLGGRLVLTIIDVSLYKLLTDAPEVTFQNPGICRINENLR